MKKANWSARTLGMYPSFIPGLKNCLKYEWVLQNTDQDSLIHKALNEMANKPYLDTWYTRVQNIKGLLGIQRINGCKNTVGLQLNKKTSRVI